MDSILSIFNQWLFFLSDNPVLRTMQILLVCAAVLVVFLVFYTTRDIVLRTRSFPYQVISVLVVACLPLVGFLFYLLFRPTRTLKDRQVEALLQEILASIGEKKKHHGDKKHPHKEASSAKPDDAMLSHS